MKTGSKVTIIGFALTGMALIASLFWAFGADNRAHDAIGKFNTFVVTGAEMDKSISKLTNDIVDKKDVNTILDDKWAATTAIGKHVDAFKAAKPVLGHEWTAVYFKETTSLFSSISDANDPISAMPFARHHIHSIELRAKLIDRFKLKYYTYKGVPGFNVGLDGQPVSPKP